jgi:hypothetical protein
MLVRELYFRIICEMAENMLNYEWPVDSHGKKGPKIKDVGELPFDHPVIKVFGGFNAPYGALVNRIRSSTLPNFHFHLYYGGCHTGFSATSATGC